MDLSDLEKLDGLKNIDYDSCKCYMHIDHRWVLPLIYYEQEAGTLPKPCTLIMFDKHHDAKEPGCLAEINHIRSAGVSFTNLIKLCEDGLSSNDDDWMKAGMELGLIDHSVVFGAEAKPWPEDLHIFQDGSGITHKIAVLSGLPGKELEYQGQLSDLAYKNALIPIWEMLGWNHSSGSGFTFIENKRRFFLSIDLDCFDISWKGYHFPWLPEVYEEEFFKVSDYCTTPGWSGKMFFEELLNRTALLAIAKEPTYCGGDKKADSILKDVNHYLFDESLSL